MDLVRQLRVKRGWSQEQLAAIAGVSRATVQRIERGALRPTWEVAQALAQALDVDASRVRSAAGLAALVSATMEITFSREPSDGELRRLPGPERAIFWKYREACREFAQAGRDVEVLAAEFEQAFDLPAGPVNEEGWAARRAVSERFFAAQQRSLRALAGHMESGLAVQRLLHRFI